MTFGGAPASIHAAAFVQQLLNSGLRDAVVSPGSRSQALALVLAEAERAALLRLHVRFDERSAGFLALGLARGSGRPVAVFTTSGSAVANLWPAVLEAHHDGVPLLVVTADRPAELIGVGANQTTRQPGIFGFAVRTTFSTDAPSVESVDDDAERAAEVARLALAAACSHVPGPVHVNLAYREPLSGPHPALRPPQITSTSLPDSAASLAAAQVREAGMQGPAAAQDVEAAGRPDGSSGLSHGIVTLSAQAGTIVIAGSGAGEGAAVLAEEAGLPLIAEVVSGARVGRTVVPHYRSALAGALGLTVTRAVVVGRPTLSREVSALLSRPEVEIVVADRGRPEPFLPRPDAVAADSVEFDGVAPLAWLDAWLAEPLDGVGVVEDETRVAVARALWHASSAGDALYFAASAMVRVADEWVPPRSVRVFANRGLAGIDGTVSTAIGVALTQPGLTRALVGDLAFLHDVGGLAVPEVEALPSIQFVVVNDRGGTIFRGLEVAGSDPDLFRRVVETPHSVHLPAVAQAYGWPFVRVDDVAELPRILAEFGPGIIEVPVD